MNKEEQLKNLIENTVNTVGEVIYNDLETGEIFSLEQLEELKETIDDCILERNKPS